MVDNGTVFHHFGPSLAEFVSHPREEGVPETCPDGGIDDEFDEVHFTDTRGDRDKMAYHRYEPADEDGDLAEAAEEAVRRVEVVLIEEQVLPELTYERFSSLRADEI